MPPSLSLLLIGWLKYLPSPLFIFLSLPFTNFLPSISFISPKTQKPLASLVATSIQQPNSFFGWVSFKVYINLLDRLSMRTLCGFVPKHHSLQIPFQGSHFRCFFGGGDDGGGEVGMLWTGTPQARELEENMASYFNILQGFLLLSYGSTVGAGPTLCSFIHASAKQIVESSFKLQKESFSSYGARSKDRKLSVTQLVGTVWEACSALKKTPATNITAIGRAMTQVAVSIKDVLREMKELKPASSHLEDEASGSASTSTEADIEPNDDELSCEGDLGSDLSPEEMRVAGLATAVVSDTVAVMKELIRTITGLLKLENSNDRSNFVESLEKLLKLSQGIGILMDDLGACLYPPQELPTIKETLEKISSIINDMQAELQNLKGNSEAFSQACNCLKLSIRKLESAVGCPNTEDLETEVEKIDLNN